MKIGINGPQQFFFTLPKNLVPGTIFINLLRIGLVKMLEEEIDENILISRDIFRFYLRNHLYVAIPYQQIQLEIC